MCWRGLGSVFLFSVTSQKVFFSHQHCFGLLPGVVASLVCGLRGVSGQGLLYAALVLWTAPDIAVVRVLRDDLLLPVDS